jgi:hypothetical protein
MLIRLVHPQQWELSLNVALKFDRTSTCAGIVLERSDGAPQPKALSGRYRRRFVGRELTVDRDYSRPRGATTKIVHSFTVPPPIVKSA